MSGLFLFDCNGVLWDYSPCYETIVDKIETDMVRRLDSPVAAILATKDPKIGKSPIDTNSTPGSTYS
jgi:hypothetical protein